MDLSCLLAWSEFELVYGQAWYVFTVQLQSDYLMSYIYSNVQRVMLIDWLMNTFILDNKK